MKYINDLTKAVPLFKCLGSEIRSVNETGTFIDGVKVSDISLYDLHIIPGSSIKLRMSADETSQHKGGLTLYGHSFGNYPQDIKVRMQYKVKE